MKRYSAPWSTTLVVMSTLGTFVLIGASLLLVVFDTQFGPWTAVLPALVLAGAIVFTVRGYTLGTAVIEVHRLIWSTRLPLEGLQSARVDPNAMRGSVRTWGNGGLFSFTGRYRNPQLGHYRAFVTDASRAVVLCFDARTVVLSPDAPEAFVRELMGRQPT